MRLTIVILIACLMQVSAAGHAQKITLLKSNISLRSIFKELKAQSGYNFFYTDNLLKDASLVDINVRNTEFKDVLKLIFDGQDLDYLVRDKTVIIKERKAPVQEIISGFVGDKKDRKPIPGVTVSIKGTKSMVQTDKNGKFTISVPSGARALEFRYLGYKTVDLPIQVNTDYTIFMEEDQQSLKETVITGMTERKAATYTGSAKTITAAELKTVSPINVFTAVAALDPAFRIIPNNISGGDINALPQLQMQGQNSFPTLGGELIGNPNQPLFILDGFEVNLQAVADLDMNRIASITLLKDASATAIYGARGANGVMVISTIVPPIGRIDVTFTNNFTLTTPDLSVYDLLDSREKLDFEQRAGLIDSYGREYIYNERYKAMLRGVNTDWKQIPVQTGYNNRTSLGLSGGDQAIRYSLNFTGDFQQGVMKEQDRNNYSGNFNLSYNVKKIRFQNQITATQVVSNASPYGSFSDYLLLNPYLAPYAADGSPNRYLENIVLTMSTGENSVIPNPLMDVSYNTIDDRNKNFTVRNNTNVQYNMNDHLWFQGNFSISKMNGTVENFYSALDSRFINITDVSRKGTYTVRSNNSLVMEGQARANYNQGFGRHMVTATAFMDLGSNRSDFYQLNTEGFPFDKLDNLLFATQYQAGKPTGSEATTNRLSYGLSFNYSFDNRYFTDINISRDGSSAYGANSRFGTFWSVGAGWNIHNEKFFTGNTIVNNLRLRGSYGSTGSLAVDPYQSQFRYNFGTTTSYYTDLGATAAGLGNPNLSWQQVLKANIGFDATFFQNRLTFVVDVYKHNTQNALTTVSLAPSTGFTSYSENLGKLKNTGLNFDIGYRILNDPAKGLRWNLSVNGATNKNILKQLSNKLKAFNERLNALGSTVPNPLLMEGESTTALYVVPSLGIDPTIGQEVFVKKDGTMTYDWNALDKVRVGDTRAKWTGGINSNVMYSGFSLNFSLAYNFGGMMYNQTLLDRVEGISAQSNVDQRAYDLGWSKPGDLATFKRIGRTANTTYATSRFVQKDNSLRLTSLSLGYDFKPSFLRNVGLQNLRLSATTNDLYTWSSIQVERGRDNPFSRSYTFGLSGRF
jgi:TonB-linked SusC/RagA family outer membrane protein